MLTVEQFYAESHEGNYFHEKGPMYGPIGHLGQDFKGWPAATPIPSWADGTVVTNGWSPNLGWIVVLRRADGKYPGFCHLATRSTLGLGHHVHVGDEIGLLGMTGRLATAPHLHTTLEPKITIGTQNALDPLPSIRAVRSGLTGSNIKPITGPARKDKKVTLYLQNSTLVRGKPVAGKTLYALAGDSPGTPANWIRLGPQAAAATKLPAVAVNDAEFAKLASDYSAPLSIKAQ